MLGRRRCVSRSRSVPVIPDIQPPHSTHVRRDELLGVPGGEELGAGSSPLRQPDEVSVNGRLQQGHSMCASEHGLPGGSIIGTVSTQQGRQHSDSGPERRRCCHLA